MCWYVSVGVSGRNAEARAAFAREAFGPLLAAQPVSDWPIGRAVLGGKREAEAFLIHDGHCCCFLQDPRRRAAEIEALTSGIHRLAERQPSVPVLLHLACGTLNREEVPLLETRRVTPAEFFDRFPRIEPEVRYLIVTPVGVAPDAAAVTGRRAARSP